MYQPNGNGNLMAQNVIQIKSGITINVNASAKNITDSVIMCDEVINAGETKTVSINFNEKMEFVKHKLSILYLLFY